MSDRLLDYRIANKAWKKANGDHMHLTVQLIQSAERQANAWKALQSAAEKLLLDEKAVIAKEQYGDQAGKD